MLSRACFVKDEQHFDRFDLAFATYFKNVNAIFDIRAEIPEEWLKKEFQRYLSEDDKKLVEALGGWDKLMETLKKRLEEQRGRHQGGSKWIGTGGTSPFGAYGYNPEGVRIGQDERRLAQRGQGLGRADVPQPRRRRRAQHAQHQGRAAPAAALRARGRAGGTRPRRHHRRHGAQRGLARLEDAGGAPQSREGAPVPRRRRLDGSARAGLRGTVLRGEERVPAPRAFLLPQLRLRPRLARQRAPAQRANGHAGTPAHLRPGLEGHLRRRRRDEPVRTLADRRQRRIHERRGRHHVADARLRAFPQGHLVEPGARARRGNTPARRRSCCRSSVRACSR